jgi:hypothetical protein
MSVKHIAWVWEHSRAEGGTLLVALALADSVNHLDGSDECWPKRELLARRVRLSERRVSDCLSELERLGEVERIRTRRGNRYRVLMPDGKSFPEEAGCTSDEQPTAHPDEQPTALPYVEPEVRTGREPEHTAEVFDLFSAWQRLTEQPEALLSPARGRAIKKLLTEEPDAAVLGEALENFAAYAKRRNRAKWEITDAFSTFKGRDAENKPVFSDLRTRINWLLSIKAEANAHRSTEEIEQQMRNVGLDPEKGLSWLQDVRIHRGRERGQEARKRLEDYGFAIVDSEERPYARLDW